MVAVPVAEPKKNIIRLHDKVCPVCGLPSFSSRATYCSRDGKCRQKAYRLRQRNGHNVTIDTIATLEEKIAYLTDLVERLATSSITQSVHKASHAAQELTLNDLPELQAKAVKLDGGQSRQNLLNAMSNMSKTSKITVKPEAKNNVIAGSDVSLTEPNFDDLEL